MDLMSIPSHLYDTTIHLIYSRLFFRPIAPGNRSRHPFAPPFVKHDALIFNGITQRPARPLRTIITTLRFGTARFVLCRFQRRHARV